MVIVNLYGGPGVGKSTLAATLFAHFKRAGYKCEMSRERAKELLYEGRDLARCQMLITATQYQHLKDLEAAGTELAICDGPLRLSLAYAKGLPFYEHFRSVVNDLCAEFTNVDVLVRRAVAYQTHGRVQGNEAEARALDAVVTSGLQFDLSLDSPDPRSAITLVRMVTEPLLKRSYVV